jgi:hypothetical protein
MRGRRVLWLFLLAILWPSLAGAHGAPTTATGVSRAFNPAISVNGLFLLRAAPDEEAEPTGDAHGAAPTAGMGVQEFEVQFTSFVDPYLKADVVLGIHGTEGIEIEEGFVLTLRPWAGVGLRAGRFYGAFGKHVPLHTHQFPFVDAPMVQGIVFGEEGLRETGVELGALLPAEWFSELTVQVTNGDNPALFQSERARDLSYLARWRNFFDLSREATADVGVSALAGPDDRGRRWSNVVGGDLTIKFKPVASYYGRVVAQGELLRARVAGEVVRGGYVLGQYQFARRWWMQGAFDWAFEGEGLDRRIRALLGYVPTEFSSLRCQYAIERHAGEDAAHSFLVQYNFTIGSHPAHSY